MPNTSRGLAIGDALVAHATANLGALSLVSIDWQKGMNAAPVYPVDPYADCPRLELRFYTEDVNAAVSGATETVLKFSWYLYLRQTPGEDHQELLRTAMEAIINLFFGNFNPTQLELAGSKFVRPAQTVIRDELRHPLVDDPSLRVSVGEIFLQADTRGQG